jgi:acyl-CoA thioester hydrolase
MKKKIDSPWKETTEIRVPFYDLDPMNVAWFGSMYKYFERAREHLLESIDFGTTEMKNTGYVWPIIESHCRHINFVEGEQTISVTAGIVDYDQQLKVRYLVHDETGDTRLATGYTVQVAIEAESGETKLDTPQVLKDKLDEARED